MRERSTRGGIKDLSVVTGMTFNLGPLTGDLFRSSGLFEPEPMRSGRRTFWNCFWCDLGLISNGHQSLLLPEIVELESTLGLL